eukprot:scaffold7841_cov128-Isochrysis_galbana.AAC.13
MGRVGPSPAGESSHHCGGDTGSGRRLPCPADPRSFDRRASRLLLQTWTQEDLWRREGCSAERMRKAGQE